MFSFIYFNILRANDLILTGGLIVAHNTANDKKTKFT